MAGAHTANVTVVHIGVIAFKVALHLAGDRDAGTFRNPFELTADAEAASFDMDLRVRRGPGIGQQKGKRPVLTAEGGAAARGCVVDRACLEETV